MNFGKKELGKLLSSMMTSKPQRRPPPRSQPKKPDIPKSDPIVAKEPVAIPEPPKKKEKKKEIAKFYPEKEFLKTFRQLTYRHRAWDVWRDFIVMLACAFSNSVDTENRDEREERYLKIIKRYSKEEQALFPELAAHTVMALDQNPEQDFLGSIFMDLGLGNDSGGQFFTPYSVCQMMASIAMTDVSDRVEKDGYFAMDDPACGAGATLIAGVNEAKRQLEKEHLNFQNHVLVSGQDIDEVTALMCYIQLSLLGVAGYFKVGNTLTEPMDASDNVKHYWFTPMYFSNVWQLRRLFRKMKGES